MMRGSSVTSHAWLSIGLPQRITPSLLSNGAVVRLHRSTSTGIDRSGSPAARPTAISSHSAKDRRDSSRSRARRGTHRQRQARRYADARFVSSACEGGAQSAAQMNQVEWTDWSMQRSSQGPWLRRCRRATAASRTLGDLGLATVPARACKRHPNGWSHHAKGISAAMWGLLSATKSDHRSGRSKPYRPIVG
jgi:hypothetical protein